MSGSSRPHLLVVGTMNRPDVVSMFSRVEARLTFLEYEDNWGVRLDPAIYEPFGEVTNWERHDSVDHVLDELRPDRVAMISINSREQVALRVAARERGVEVVHVEHGYRLPLQARLEQEEEHRGSRDRSPGSSRKQSNWGTPVYTVRSARESGTRSASRWKAKHSGAKDR